MSIKVIVKNSMLALVLIGAVSCSATYEKHGFTPQDAQLARINAGIDSKSDVAAKIGEPVDAGLFTEDAWYYISSTVRHYTYNPPQTTERRIVEIQFDSFDVVTAVNVASLEDGRKISPIRRITETQGAGPSAISQIFSNLFRPTLQE